MSKTSLLPQQDHHKAGVLLGLLSAACVGITSALTNILADTVSAPELAFALGAAGLITLTPMVAKRLPILVSPHASAIWVRAIGGAISIVCFIWNLQHTDVGAAHILFNFSLIFVLMVEFAIDKAGHSIFTAIYVVMAVLGIAVYWYSGNLLVDGQVLAIGLFGAVCATIGYVALKRASQRYDPLLILWTLSLVLIPVSILTKSDGWAISSGKAMLIMVAISLGNLFAQFLLNLSFKRLPLPVAAALVPSCVVWSVLIVEITQRVAPSPQAVAGMLIYAASMGLLVAHSKKRKPALA